ncbi:lipid-A-disaccharide synthase [uncultured Enterovirga sp.]|uniref:lipid-A-disaccharide synthase n=1 Tax=uncultured Enterovirga sp. TaxID=2026352 RepID=UPI0035CC9349
MAEPLRVFLVAGEPSGDQLGASLIRALRKGHPGEVIVEGVGAEAMAREGLRSIFPLTDITAMGVIQVVRKLPLILRRASDVVAAAVAARPDVLVIIDSPDFTHPVARRIARRMPDLPIVNYVSPTVWAWRPGRAAKMRRYVAHVLALKPFEPAAHLRLGGPPCTYIGHPLIERLDDLAPAAGERSPLSEGPLRLVVLPGSRRGEISRLMAPFGETLRRVVAGSEREIEVTLPAVPHLSAEIRRAAEGWPVKPRIVEGEAAKYEAFRRSHVALAASGTVTLELALAGVPMVVAYQVSRAEGLLKFLITTSTIVLANLVVGENVVPEFTQEDCIPEKLAAAVMPLLDDTPERRRQAEAFARLPEILEADAPTTPSERAAAIVLRVVAEWRAGTRLG